MERPLPQTAWKFGAVAPDGMNLPFRYGGHWDIEKTTGPERMILAPASDHVGLLVDLMGELPEPFGILYLLLVSRRDHEPGRYQSPVPTDRAATAAFLHRYRDYFEGDGRHHVWVLSLPASATIIYDHHDVLYAYGPLERYRAVAEARGMSRGPVRYPVPHTHCYNEGQDEAEDAILNHWVWLRTPLRPEDDPDL